MATYTPDSTSVQTSRAPGAARLSFADGDTYKRFTITDASVSASTPPFCQIVRDTVSDDDDAGWHFDVCVVSVAAGTFDVTVTATVLGEPPVDNESPNEVVTLAYSLQPVPIP